MSTRLLSFAYQLLLRSYPAQTRAERGPVELDTLLAVSRPAQRMPKFREARAIVKEGIHHRIAHTAGRSPLEVVSHGATMGVLFTMSVQLYWLGIIAHKMTGHTVDNLPGNSWTRMAPVLSWIGVVAVCALWWSLRPNRFTIVAWQIANVTGVLLLVDVVRREATDWSNDLGETLASMGVIICLLSLSSCLALFCWSKLGPNTNVPQNQRAPLGLRFAALCVGLPLWASPLFGAIQKHGNNVLVIAIVCMLVLSVIDPRLLIGLTIAVATPFLGASIAAVASPQTGMGLRLLLPALTLSAIGLTSLRARVLVRRCTSSLT